MDDGYFYIYTTRLILLLTLTLAWDNFMQNAFIS